MHAAESLTLAHLLALAALVAGSCEYVEIVKRRRIRRAADSERRASEAAGLRGLVRVFLADPPERAAGTRRAD